MAQQSLQHGMARKIKTGTHVILRLRPAMHAMQEWSVMFQFLATAGERLWDDQPPMQAARNIKKRSRKHRGRRNKAKDEMEE